MFLRALVHLDRLRDTEGRVAWLICVTRNLAIDWQRRKQTASRVINEMTQLSRTHFDQALSGRDSARERLMQREENAVLDDALASLPVEQRELVLLHFLNGEIRRGIATRLGVHPATVGRRLDAALEKLGFLVIHENREADVLFVNPES